MLPSVIHHCVMMAAIQNNVWRDLYLCIIDEKYPASVSLNLVFSTIIDFKKRRASYPPRVCPVWRSGPRRKRWSLAVVFDFNWNIIISQPGEDGWDVRNVFPNKVQILSAHSLRIFKKGTIFLIFQFFLKFQKKLTH